MKGLLARLRRPKKQEAKKEEPDRMQVLIEELRAELNGVQDIIDRMSPVKVQMFDSSTGLWSPITGDLYTYSGRFTREELEAWGIRLLAAAESSASVEDSAPATP